MSWFTSLKEKSMKLAQLYKNELSDFMTNLNDEITGKNSDSPEETRSSQQSPEKERFHIETIYVSPSHMAIVHFLRPFLSKIVDDEELRAKITLVLSDPGEYIQDNITRLILPDRTDFTTFMEFQKNCTISNEDYEKIVSSDPELQKLLIDNHLEKNLESDSPIDRLQCFLYYIIYLFEDKQDKEPSFELPQSANPEQDIVFPRDDDGAIQNAGDALEKKTDLSDPYVVVEDGSSNSHGSNSNETERIESSGQRDVVSVSGSEDWQVEEKMFALEFNG